MSRTIKIFGTDVLNIFCDASIKTQDGVTYGCPGSIAVYRDKVIDYKSTILVKSTNNESEIYAIMLATQQAIQFKDQYKRINIFSDSMISVRGVREWMVSWVKNQKNGVLMSSSGVVANQQLFLHVVNLILTYLDEYYLYHIDGHVSDTESGIFKAMIDFAKFNKINIGPVETQFLCQYNNLIDNTTRGELEATDLSNLVRLQQGIIYPIPSRLDMLKLTGEIMDN